MNGSEGCQCICKLHVHGSGPEIIIKFPPDQKRIKDAGCSTNEGDYRRRGDCRRCRPRSSAFPAVPSPYSPPVSPPHFPLTTPYNCRQGPNSHPLLRLDFDVPWTLPLSSRKPPPPASPKQPTSTRPSTITTSNSSSSIPHSNSSSLHLSSSSPPSPLPILSLPMPPTTTPGYPPPHSLSPAISSSSPPSAAHHIRTSARAPTLALALPLT